MSRTSLLALWPGTERKSEELVELRNSWGSAPVVWGALCEEYFGDSHIWFLRRGHSNPLGYIAKDLTVSVEIRAVLLITFTTIYVRRENFVRIAAAIRKFETDYASRMTKNGVDHWPAIAELFESNPEVPAIGLHCSSVDPNPFEKWDEDGKQVSLDWSNFSDVYDYIAERDERSRDGQTKKAST